MTSGGYPHTFPLALAGRGADREVAKGEHLAPLAEGPRSEALLQNDATGLSLVSLLPGFAAHSGTAASALFIGKKQGYISPSGEAVKRV